MDSSFTPRELSLEVFKVVPFHNLSVGAVFGAMGLGFCLSLLFFMDQNISAALVNAQQNKYVKKASIIYTKQLLLHTHNLKIDLLQSTCVYQVQGHTQSWLTI